MSQIISALANEQRIRVMVCEITEIVQQAKDRHGLWPTATAALGRTMAMGALMAFQLKNENELVSIRIEGDGPLELIRVDALQNGNIVGFVKNPEVTLINQMTNKLDVAQAIGRGTLSVTRNYQLKQEFTSSIELISGEIAEDFAYYFTQSEQLPSAVSLGVLVDENGNVLSAGGLLIQMLPGHTETDIEMAEYVVAHLKPISQILHEGMTPKDIAVSLFEDLEVVDQQQAQFKCHCDKEQMRRALMTLSLEDLAELSQDNQPIEMECQYCNEHYLFDKGEIEHMMTEKSYVENRKA